MKKIQVLEPISKPTAARLENGYESTALPKVPLAFLTWTTLSNTAEIERERLAAGGGITKHPGAITPKIHRQTRRRDR